MDSSSAPRKRKRTASQPSSPASSPPIVTHLPNAIINPLSHTPGILKQLLAAGLTENDRTPSIFQPGFPHRPYRDPTTRRRQRRWKAPSTAPIADTDTDESRAETDFETEAESEAESALPKPQSYAAERAALQPLARSIAVFLARGDIPAAKRAFGLLMRSRVSGKPVDIRRNHYWELGAEILMREPVPAEKAPWAPAEDGEAQNERRKKQHRYPIANVPQVKEYFQSLIRNYPHHLGARKAASALQFWPAQVSYEISQMHAQHSAALEDLNVAAENWDMENDPDLDMYNAEPEDGFGSEDRDPFTLDASPSGRHRGIDSLADARETRLRQARDEIRTKTLDGMRDLASRMDKILDSPPFSRSPELQRLRGITSLYIADLLVPAHAPQPGDREEAEAKKLAEGEIAMGFFRKMAELGGQLDPAMQEALDKDREGSEAPAMPTFASLPIRDHRAED